MVQVAKDAAETGIEISLWHMNKDAASRFDVSLFYKRILIVPDDDAEAAEMELEFRVKGADFDGFDTMLALVKRKESRKRRLGQLCLYFSLPPLRASRDDDGGALADAPVEQAEALLQPAEQAQVLRSTPRISLQVYKTLNVTKRPYPVPLYAATNEPLTVRTRMMDALTGATVAAEEVDTYVELFGSRVSISASDWTTVKRAASMDEASLVLLKFVPRAALRHDLNKTTATLLFPHDDGDTDSGAVKGSCCLCVALIEEMLTRNCVAIAVYTRVRRANPQIVALLPQREQSDDVHDDEAAALPARSCHGGLYLIPLPFAGEVRPAPGAAAGPVAAVHVSDAALDAATRLVNSNAAHDDNAAADAADGAGDVFDPHDLSNPSLQRFYGVLQAVALTEDLVNARMGEDALRPRPNEAQHAAAVDVLRAVGAPDGDAAAPAPVSVMMLCYAA